MLFWHTGYTRQVFRSARESSIRDIHTVGVVRACYQQRMALFDLRKELVKLVSRPRFCKPSYDSNDTRRGLCIHGASRRVLGPPTSAGDNA